MEVVRQNASRRIQVLVDNGEFLSKTKYLAVWIPLRNRNHMKKIVFIRDVPGYMEDRVGG